ncbi:hypothetical protein EKD62_17175 [Shigella sonnei]|nr:hypothetical protein [Shigella sonnei]EFX5685106.1 hypothetical protein [Shigella sonnei]EFX5970117.1 hypothetical protein [Shigella sonnei]EFX6193726.1 hypothetical protein [Shigella sonnei]EFX6301837.1 hypothetical protein [Shigella sonnei]
MVVRETTHRFSRLSFHRAMVGRRLPLLKTASGLTWLAFCPEQERKELIEMLAARPGDDYQLAREPLKLQAILARAQRGLRTELPRLGSGGEDRLYRRTAAQ